MTEQLFNYFDHALLQSEADERAVLKCCREAMEFNFYAIAINPYWVPVAKKELTGTDVKIVGVSGFPLSANTTAIKIAEALKGVEDGADEIDMVANVGLLASGEFKKAEVEISQVRRNLPKDIILKVIIEAPKLTPEQQIDATKAVIGGGAQFVKTATGFFGGATVEIVKRLKQAAQNQIRVKASGGIKTLADAEAMIAAGADRLGSSSSAAIMRELLGIPKA
jgi:deoxyribose-phosphate aldolase